MYIANHNCYLINEGRIISDGGLAGKKFLKMSQVPESKEKAVKRLARYLRERSYPRLLFFAILVLTGIVGIASSLLMLRIGFRWMWIRYPIAAFIAYYAFLFLLRLWRDRQLSRPEFVDEIRRVTDEEGVAESPAVQSSIEVHEKKDSWWNAFDLLWIPDDDSASFIVVAVLAVICVAIFLVGMVLSVAPTLFSEVLLDGALITGIWHRFKKLSVDDPLGAAFRITRIPALLAILMLFVIGYLLEIAVPSAKSLGDVIRSLLNQ